MDWCYKRNKNPPSNSVKEEEFLLKYNESLLNFNKPSKDRFLEMSEVLHLMRNTLHFPLNKEITHWLGARACTFLEAPLEKRKEERRQAPPH